jgi:hypothetical protein
MVCQLRTGFRSRLASQFRRHPRLQLGACEVLERHWTRSPGGPTQGGTGNYDAQGPHQELVTARTVGIVASGAAGLALDDPDFPTEIFRRPPPRPSSDGYG